MTDQQDQGTSPNQPGTGQDDPQEQTEERLKRGKDPNQFFQSAREELKSERPQRPVTGSNARPDLSPSGYSFGSFEAGVDPSAQKAPAPAPQPGFFDEPGSKSQPAGPSGASTVPTQGSGAQPEGGKQLPDEQSSPRASNTGLTPTQSQFFDEPLSASKASGQPSQAQQGKAQESQYVPPPPPGLEGAQPPAGYSAPKGPAQPEGGKQPKAGAQQQIAGYFPEAGRPSSSPDQGNSSLPSPQAPSVEFDESDEEYEPRRPPKEGDSNYSKRLPLVDSRPRKEPPVKPVVKAQDKDRFNKDDYGYDENEDKHKDEDEDEDEDSDEQEDTDGGASAKKLQARSDRFKKLEKLVTPETKSIVTYTFLEAKEILLAPKVFFSRLPDSDDVGEAAIFLFICAAAGGLLAGFVNFNLLVTPGFFFCNVVSTFIVAAIMTKVVPSTNKKGGFASVFRIVAYSQAACFMISGLKLGPYGLLTLAPATFYCIKLQLMGFESRMGIPQKQLMAPLIGTTLFLLIVRWKIGCL